MKRVLFILAVVICLMYLFAWNWFGVLMFIIIAVYLIKNKYEEIIIDNKKKVAIFPQSRAIFNEKRLYDFIFSIQEYYEYNPQVFIDMVRNINDMLILYNTILIDNSIAGIEYEKIIRKNYQALNNLQSIIYTLPNNKLVIEKYNKAKERLYELLNSYSENIKKININYITTNNINNETVFKPFNIKSSNEPFGGEEKTIVSINKLI